MAKVYPHSIRRKNRRRKQRRDGQPKGGCLGILFLVIGLVLAGTLLFGGSLYASFLDGLPDIARLEELDQIDKTAASPTQIYATGMVNGRSSPVLIAEIGGSTEDIQQWLPFEQIPRVIIDATIAYEEPAFWVAKSAERQVWEQLVQLANGTESPAITRQLVRRHLLEPDGSNPATFQRQLQELTLARWINGRYSKQQILEWHLNTVYYGRLAIGIEAAAQRYFGKDTASLNTAEAAMLIAIPQEPSSNPIDAPAQAKQNQTAVLEAMQAAGSLTQTAAQSWQQTPLDINTHTQLSAETIAPHFAEMVQQELEQRFGPEAVLRDGLQVFTTLDLDLQRQAECLARARVAQLNGQNTRVELGNCPALTFLPPLPTATAESASEQNIEHIVENAAIVVMNPRRGRIEALVGGLDFWDAQINGSFNEAVAGRHPPGSVFQPFIYLTALSRGYAPATMLLDVETEFVHRGKLFVPQNGNGRFQGPIRLREALGNSVGVTAVQLLNWVGIDATLRTAQALGVTTLGTDAQVYDLSLALGNQDVSLLDMVFAYSVIDNLGVMTGQAGDEGGKRPFNPIILERVEDAAGNILYANDQPQQREIITPELAFLMSDMLADRQARCLTYGCPNNLELPDNRPAAVKTSLSNDDQNSWTIGYTPQHVIGVWLGGPSSSTGAAIQNRQDTLGAASIWQALMTYAHQNEPIESWPQPESLLEINVCATSGLLPNAHCPTVTELFIPGTQPTNIDNIYQEIAINRNTGRLATIYTPPELIEQKLYKTYPPAAAEWAKSEGIELPPTEYDTVLAVPPGNEFVAITDPAPFAAVQGEINILGNANGDDFAFYRLAFFPGLWPQDLQIIADNITDQKSGGALGVWDTGSLTGLHTLLLTVVHEDGSFEEVSVPVTIAN